MPKSEVLEFSAESIMSRSSVFSRSVRRSVKVGISISAASYVPSSSSVSCLSVCSSESVCELSLWIYVLCSGTGPLLTNRLTSCPACISSPAAGSVFMTVSAATVSLYLSRLTGVPPACAISCSASA